MIYEIYFRSGADQVDARDDGEIDIFDDVGNSAFGSKHITVAEMVKRVNMHDELLAALEVTVKCGDFSNALREDIKAAIAKAKGTR